MIEAHCFNVVPTGVYIPYSTDIVLKIEERIKSELRFDQARILFGKRVGNFAVCDFVGNANHAIYHFLNGCFSRRVGVAAHARIDDLSAEVAARCNPVGVQRRGCILEQFCRRDQIIVLARSEFIGGFATAFVKEQEFNGVKSLERVVEVV